MAIHTYTHGGKLGDIVYGLAALKALGQKVRLALHPNEPQHRLTKSEADALIPLVTRQTYIDEVYYTERAEGLRLDAWRLGYDTQKNLASAHGEALGVTCDLNATWLEVDHVAEDAPAVIIARSLRHPGHGFPWADVLARYGRYATFVGLPEEHRTFCNSFGDVLYLKTDDFLALARVLAGCKLFIGNQSAPMAVAVGLGVPYIQETFNPSPNCIFARPKAQHIRNGDSIAWPDVV